MQGAVAYTLRGRPKLNGEVDLPPREIDLNHIELPILQRIFHVGPSNVLIEGRRHVNREKAERLQAYCSEQIDTQSYAWEFLAYWVAEK